MLRPSNPADLVSLLLQAKPLPIVAYGRHSMASGRGDALPWGDMVEEWLLNRGRHHTWVLSSRGMAMGLVCCCQYKSPSSWEIDLLHIAPGKERALEEMLEDLNIRLGRLGIERLVLRLPEDSALRPTIMDTGFTPLMREKLYVRSPGELGSVVVTEGENAHRPGQETDIYQLFKLYTASVPAPVRQMEGLTLNHWQQTPVNGDLPQEKRWVLEKDGQVTAAVTMVKGNGKRRMLEVLTNPRDPANVERLVAEALEAEGSRSTLVTLLPEYLWGKCSVEKILTDMDFRETAALMVYVKPMVVRVRSVGMLPVRA